MHKVLPWLLAFFVFVLLFVFVTKNSSVIRAAVGHVVISQIQVSGATANDEFVELYNPTNSDVDMSGWRLIKESQTASSSSNLVASMSGTIASHRYFLIAFPNPNGYMGSVTPDEFYSSTSSGIANNNTVVLFSDAGITTVDKVGMGTAADKETAAAPLPSPSGSIQRKIDDTGGHGTDTNNNSTDFELLVTSDPRNSSTMTATPTSTATATPTNTSTSTPTSSPTATPTTTSTPTNTPTNSPTSTPVVTPTSTVFPFPFRPLVFTCHVNYITINMGWFMFSLPQIFCGWNLQ